MTSPEIEFTTLADEPLSAKYRQTLSAAADGSLVFSLWAEQRRGTIDLGPAGSLTWSPT